MNSLRWCFAVWFAVSLLGVMVVFVGVTFLHLQHELRVEKWERAPPDRQDWILHGSYLEAEVEDIAHELWWLALLYVAPVIVLALVTGYYLAKRSFRPVADMNRQLQEINVHSLNQRVRLRCDRRTRSFGR